MNSLSELKEFFISHHIPINQFGGWYLKVDNDVWTLFDGTFYLNGAPKSLQDKQFFKNYLKEGNQHVKNQGSKARKWRGISSRNYRGK